MSNLFLYDIEELDEIKNMILADSDGVLQHEQVATVTRLIDEARVRWSREANRLQARNAGLAKRFEHWNRQNERLGETKGMLLFHHFVVIVWCLISFPVFLTPNSNLASAPIEMRWSMLWAVLPMVFVYHLPCIWLAFNLRRCPKAMLWIAFAASLYFVGVTVIWAFNILESPFDLYRENLTMQFAILMLLSVMNAAQAIWIFFAIRARSVSSDDFIVQ